MTAAAPASVPAVSGDPGGRIPLVSPPPLRPDPTWGGGQREAGSPPGSNMAPPRHRPNRGCGYSLSPGRPQGGGKCWGRAPSGRSAGQCSGLGSLRRPAEAPRQAAPSRRPLPSPQPLQPRQAPRARLGRELTGGGVGCTGDPCTRGTSPPSRNTEASWASSFFSQPCFRTHFSSPCSQGPQRHMPACAAQPGAWREHPTMHRFGPGAKHLP